MRRVTASRRRSIDMEKLKAANPMSIAVGTRGPNMNARGDLLGPGGKIIRTRAEILADWTQRHGDRSNSQAFQVGFNQIDGKGLAAANEANAKRAKAAAEAFNRLKVANTAINQQLSSVTYGPQDMQVEPEQLETISIAEAAKMIPPKHQVKRKREIVESE